jgi:hypothetical protein
MLSKYKDSNNIINIEELKLKNYYAYMLLRKNYKLLSKILYEQYDIGIYDKKHKYMDKGHLYGYIKNTYTTDTINLTEIREKSWYEYIQIAKFGNPKELLTKFGYNVIYGSDNNDICNRT